jgi:hypothetical protein
MTKTDLVARLRGFDSQMSAFEAWSSIWHDETVLKEAADEIERLSLIEIKYKNLCPVLNEQAAEIQRLQQALAFWLPHMPAEPLPPYIDERLESAIWMLTGYNGPIEEGAEHLGWIKACFEPEREPG